MRDMFRAMTGKAPLADRLRKHVLRLADDHPTKKLCLEAAAALDVPPLVEPVEPHVRYCASCNESSVTALDVCPECSAPL